MIFILPLLLSFASASDPLRTRENNKAAELIEQDQSLEAQGLLQRSVVNHNDRAELHYNLGLSYDKNENFDKALKEYEIAAQTTKDANLKFLANFNAARILGDKKLVGEALSKYQAALDANPGSVEAKTNIELLTKEDAGGGQGKDKKDPKDQKNDQNEDKKDGKQDQSDKSQGDKDKKDQNPQQKQDQKKQQPQEYKPENLSKEDVQKIFEELKRQEDKIRGKIYEEKKSRETPVDKDW